MKIGNELHAQELSRLNQGRSSSATGSAAFADILAQAVTEQPTGTASVSATECASSCTAGSAAEFSLCQQTYGLLDALETYGQALADGSKTLKEIEPLAADLESRAQSLGDSLEQSGQDGQEGLSGIAMQALTQARVESIKFRRGDYV